MQNFIHRQYLPKLSTLVELRVTSVFGRNHGELALRDAEFFYVEACPGCVDIHERAVLRSRDRPLRDGHVATQLQDRAMILLRRLDIPR